VSVTLDVGDTQLVFDTDAGDGVVRLGDRVIGRGSFDSICSRFRSGLERALSDEFTVVGAIDGVPVVHLLSFDEPTHSLYLTMDANTLIVQREDGGDVEARVPVSRDLLARWLDTI